MCTTILLLSSQCSHTYYPFRRIWSTDLDYSGSCGFGTFSNLQWSLLWQVSWHECLCKCNGGWTEQNNWLFNKSSNKFSFSILVVLGCKMKINHCIGVVRLLYCQLLKSAFFFFTHSARSCVSVSLSKALYQKTWSRWPAYYKFTWIG